MKPRRINSHLLAIKASLHNHTDEQGKHLAGYPVESLLSFLRKEKFDIAAITDHNQVGSAQAFSLAKKHPVFGLWLLPGFEANEEAAHIVSLKLGRRSYRFFCHPYRTFQESWTEQVKARMKNCQAVELDQTISFKPELLAGYQSLAKNWPVLATADFHSSLFALKNFFTVILVREKSFSGLLAALEQRNLVAFYPDILSWKRKFVSPASRQTLAYLQRKYPKLFQIEPAVEPKAMGEKDIQEYWSSQLITLKKGYCSASLLPDFGGQLVSFKVKKTQFFSPVFPTFLESPRIFASHPTFESNFSRWKILSQSGNFLALEYRIEKAPWRGLLLRRKISLGENSLSLHLWPENYTGKPIRFSPCFTFNFLRKPGEITNLKILKPEPKKYLLKSSFFS
ncbi:MAG: hypothetical protein NC823_02560 [Candidatus Omnitrophica bacterium]|nr:hypothetical protein [Candidatus Omnitrophota bacterium]